MCWYVCLEVSVRSCFLGACTGQGTEYPNTLHWPRKKTEHEKSVLVFCKVKT